MLCNYRKKKRSPGEEKPASLGLSFIFCRYRVDARYKRVINPFLLNSIRSMPYIARDKWENSRSVTSPLPVRYLIFVVMLSGQCRPGGKLPGLINGSVKRLTMKTLAWRRYCER